MSSDPRHLLDIADLSDVAIEEILQGPTAARPAPGCTVGLLFLSSSLRTRLGFAAAATRLGALPLTVDERRDGRQMSAPESFHDTLRTVAGMVDVVVVRTDHALDRTLARRMPIPVINGGDPGGEHPTQALIDVAAMERFAGPVAELHVGICGDLTMRGTRSLLALLARRRPRALTLIAPASRREHGVPLTGSVDYRECADFTGLDVLVMTGLAPAGDPDLDEAGRGRFALTAATAGAMPDDAIVLSPMPVIDEIHERVRYTDPRIRIFEQSDLGVDVRTAVLQHVLLQRSEFSSSTSSNEASRR